MTSNSLSNIGGPEEPETAPCEPTTRLTVDLPVACALLGISRTLGYELVRRGEFPVPVMRFGRRVVVPVHAICIKLGIEPDPGEIMTAEKLQHLVFGDDSSDPAA